MPNGHYSPHSSSIGNTDANIISALAYILPVVLSFVPIIGGLSWFIPIFMFFLEKNSNLVKFHSMQSVALHIIKVAVLAVVSIFSFIPILGSLAHFICSLFFMVISVFVIIRSYSYDEYKLPFIGDFVAKLIK